MTENPLQEPGRSLRAMDPCVLVIFGASGDLTSRKLAPALYNLGKEQMLPPNFACIGFARREKTTEAFRKEIEEDVQKYSRTKPIDPPFWDHFSEQLFYHASSFDQDEGYLSLKKKMEEMDLLRATKGNRIFYLSVQPKYFPIIVEKLKKHGLLYDPKDPTKWSRVIIEKPFGHDLSSAKELQSTLSQYLAESQTYRIDHYLGKETVQNILVLRFGNSIFESLWNYKHVDHVQITVAEDLGIGSRGNFFEEEGLLRDVLQNHVMQLLSLVAMEPPVSLAADAIRDEKVKVLQSIRPLREKDFVENVLRGQYTEGFVNGQKVVGYRQEQNVSPTSSIETFVAARLFIDNWRWAGVPFYLRCGKRLPKRGTEIAVIFKDAPGVLFQQNGRKNDPNILALKIQPDEGISMKINCKVPGPSSPLQPVKMDFRYGSYFGQSPPEAYERLIWDCMMGDSTLFARADEVMSSWNLYTPLLQHWASQPHELSLYPAGSWGPSTATEWMKKEGKTWRIL